MQVAIWDTAVTFNKKCIVSTTLPGEVAACVGVPGAFAHLAPAFLFKYYQRLYRWLELWLSGGFGTVFCVLWGKFLNLCKAQLNVNGNCFMNLNAEQKHLHSA